MKRIVIAALALCALQAFDTAAAQSSDTLKKIKEAGVITLGGRDTSFPFS